LIDFWSICPTPRQAPMQKAPSQSSRNMFNR
jgi:hypothetical protein